jgi:Fur family iron response transcriptional regulator
MKLQKDISDQELAARFRAHDIGMTRQRLAIARLLFRLGRHVSADDVYVKVNGDRPRGSGQHVSKATVYNTLGLFARRGLVREVIADPTRVFYDPNTRPHHHFYDVDSGELTDIDEDKVNLDRLPAVPEGTQLQGVDVIIRVGRRNESGTA